VKKLKKLAILKKLALKEALAGPAPAGPRPRPRRRDRAPAPFWETPITDDWSRRLPSCEVGACDFGKDDEVVVHCGYRSPPSLQAGWHMWEPG
jgi:hypothetical protein